MFIDDYFRWRVGSSAEANLAKIQSEDIPRIEDWARRTGSSFAAEKTELIHLARKKTKHWVGQFVVNGTVVRPSATAKLLGVIFDQELRWTITYSRPSNRQPRPTSLCAGYDTYAQNR